MPCVPTSETHRKDPVAGGLVSILLGLQDTEPLLARGLLPRLELLPERHIPYKSPITAGIHLDVAHVLSRDDDVRLIPQRKHR